MSCKSQVVTFNWKEKEHNTTETYNFPRLFTYLMPDKIEVSAVEHKMTVKITKNFFESKMSFLEFYLIQNMVAKRS